MTICPNRVPAAQLMGNAIAARFVLTLVCKGAKQAIPKHKHTAIVFIDVAGVFRMMHTMIRRRYQNVIKNTESTHVLSMHPKLIHQVKTANTDDNLNRRAQQVHRQIKHKANVVGAGLTQRSTQVVLFALVMGRMGGPHKTPLMAESMLPVVTKIVADKRQRPLPPMLSGPLGDAK